jgi:hypothetical protein
MYVPHDYVAWKITNIPYIKTAAYFLNILQYVSQSTKGIQAFENLLDCVSNTIRPVLECLTADGLRQNRTETEIRDVEVIS